MQKFHPAKTRLGTIEHHDLTVDQKTRAGQISFRYSEPTFLRIRKISPDLSKYQHQETIMLGFLLWIIVFVLCWPIALLALLLYPIVWLVLLPFRLIGITVDAVFELIRAIIFLPARILGGRPH